MPTDNITMPVILILRNNTKSSRFQYGLICPIDPFRRDLLFWSPCRS